MAQVNFEFSDLSELVKVGKQEAIDILTNLGFPTEIMENGQLTVEVTPNRADALCVEGLARVLESYQGGKPTTYKVGAAKIAATIDKSVAPVRPYFGAAVVRNLKMTDSLLRSLIQVQEKLHDTLGRKRRKVAIGIHDLDSVKAPFRYYATGRRGVTFVPLESSKKMTPEEILQKHPKGVAFAHLVGEWCPMIVDSKGAVLSFPPVINGELTKLSGKTKNVFIDCTGTSDTAVRQAVNILVAMLAERGGEIEEVKVNGKAYALLQEEKRKLPTLAASKLLGVKFSDSQVSSLLSKMGFRVQGKAAFVPGYRIDVMDEVDLIEDIAVAYGYNNFEPKLPTFASTGAVQPESYVHDALIGLGFDEVMTWNLSNDSLERKAGVESAKKAEIANPTNAEYTAFRTSLIPNMLLAMSESKGEKLPIKFYEEGPVAAPVLEKRLAVALMHPKANLSEIVGVVKSLAEASGKEVRLEKASSASFVEGRCAEVYLGGKKAGVLGEIAPAVLVAFGLEQPVCLAELFFY